MIDWLIDREIEGEKRDRLKVSENKYEARGAF